ncbi:MAG: bifunctional DNA-formamidopyrimidine glycosylase/DNA-(apurinic or apyrimidinic site) lyase [Proteobacteria bacterium]|nr:bifunctional DNA-formamidopyrimidine glycosylase/DNA-(apurinic or apyrimidinic site) lyase [Pseudomonadota bacterium]
MPELPEVETTRRGVAPHARGRRIARLAVHEPRLRWPIAPTLPRALSGARIERVGRRAKYLLLHLDRGTLLLHLGMSGSLRVVSVDAPRRLHDHFDLVLDSGTALRFHDPRRFGSLLYTREDPARHPLLRHLAPEPLGAAFTPDYLWRLTRGRRVTIKQLLMNSHCVVGVGNIYASEALFRARIRPQRRAASLTQAESVQLVRAIRTVLTQAIRAGGTTLRDFLRSDGEPGYFRQRLYVYERAGRACRRCGSRIRQLTQGQRSTYYCPACQQ